MGHGTRLGEPAPGMWHGFRARVAAFRGAVATWGGAWGDCQCCLAAAPGWRHRGCWGLPGLVPWRWHLRGVQHGPGGSWSSTPHWCQVLRPFVSATYMPTDVRGRGGGHYSPFALGNDPPSVGWHFPCASQQLALGASAGPFPHPTPGAGMPEERHPPAVRTAFHTKVVVCTGAVPPLWPL